MNILNTTHLVLTLPNVAFVFRTLQCTFICVVQCINTICTYHSVADSLDLVPIGAFYGHGKRTGMYGAYLLACYEPDHEQYQSVCKIGTGFSNERLLVRILQLHLLEVMKSFL
jgi:ATP dependent DNA ligase C terminal region